MNNKDLIECCKAVLDFLFTKYLNEKFQLGYSIADEEGNLRPFFEKHSRHFYKSLIRDLTINEIIEDEME